MTSKPNVIVCLCDQLRAFELGCYGNKVIRTPNIDLLAAGGARFEHAVSNNPVCMPAHSSLMSGQYGRSCGPIRNYVEQDDNGQCPIIPCQSESICGLIFTLTGREIYE